MYWLIILTLLEGGLFAKPVKAYPSYADCQYAMHGVKTVIKAEHQSVVCLKIKLENGNEASKKSS